MSENINSLNFGPLILRWFSFNPSCETINQKQQCCSHFHWWNIDKRQLLKWVMDSPKGTKSIDPHVRCLCHSMSKAVTDPSFNVFLILWALSAQIMFLLLNPCYYTKYIHVSRYRSQKFWTENFFTDETMSWWFVVDSSPVQNSDSYELNYKLLNLKQCFNETPRK